jgi:hypothetical protein
MLVARVRTDTQPEARSASRRIVRLEVGLKEIDSGSPALIENLSEDGLLLRTTAPLKVNDRLEVHIPPGSTALADVVRIDGDAYGCRFVDPIARSAVSAAQLFAPFNQSDADLYGRERQLRARAGAAQSSDRVAPASNSLPDWQANLALALLLIAVVGLVIVLATAIVAV